MPATRTTSKAAPSAHVENKNVKIEHVERPNVQARQAIGVFNSGSGGMVAAAYLSRILRDADENLSVIFFGDTANLPYGKKTEQPVATLSNSIINRLAPLAPSSGSPATLPVHRGPTSGRLEKQKDGRVFSASSTSIDDEFKWVPSGGVIVSMPLAKAGDAHPLLKDRWMASVGYGTPPIDDEFKWVPGGVIVGMPLDKAGDAHPLLKDAMDGFLDSVRGRQGLAGRLSPHSSFITTPSGGHRAPT